MFSNKPTTPEPTAPKVAPKPSTNGNSSSIVNIIGTGTSISGEVFCDGDIRIDGMVKGTITSKAKIVIGSTGSVDGDIICENADISGKIFGSLKVEELLFLKASSYIEGDITTGKFVVETGAKFNGNCRMGVKEIKPNDKFNTSAPTQIQKEAV